MRNTPKIENDMNVSRNSSYHRIFALKAAIEAERVLPLFEHERPHDRRPNLAIKAIKAWANGKKKLRMAEVRKLSLDAHAAARACESDSATFAARAAGQAVATWHVPTHAMAVPKYAYKAVAARKIEVLAIVDKARHRTPRGGGRGLTSRSS